MYYGKCRSVCVGICVVGMCVYRLQNISIWTSALIWHCISIITIIHFNYHTMDITFLTFQLVNFISVLVLR